MLTKPRHPTSIGSSAVTGGLRHLSHASNLLRVFSLSLSLSNILYAPLTLSFARDDGLMRDRETERQRGRKREREKEEEREKEIERPSSAYDSGNDESSPASKSVPIVSTRVLAKGKCHYHMFSNVCLAVDRLAPRIFYEVPLSPSSLSVSLPPIRAFSTAEQSGNTSGKARIKVPLSKQG